MMCFINSELSLCGQDSGFTLRRDLTVDEEEKAETTVVEFLQDREDKFNGPTTKEEMAFCMKYMKKLLMEKESDYSEEIRVLKDQINDLKCKLGDYLAKENTMSFSTQRSDFPLKENAGDILIMAKQSENKIDNFEIRKKKSGFARQNIAHAKFIPKVENGPFIGDFPA